MKESQVKELSSSTVKKLVNLMGSDIWLKMKLLKKLMVLEMIFLNILWSYVRFPTPFLMRKKNGFPNSISLI